MDRYPKNARILDIYVRLCEGKTITKVEEAQHFGVDERSIQRDIDDIRAFIAERRAENSLDQRSVEYSRVKKGFVMTGTEGSMMTNSEILAISKILLESRAFSKREITIILNKLIEGCVPLRNMKLVNDLISNEKYHYVELQRKEYIQDKLWMIGQDIREHNLVEIHYARGDAPQKTVHRTVEPVAILFSEYYFYLNAFIVEEDAKGQFVHKYDYPAIFRIDRIQAYKNAGRKFKVIYSTRFEEGEFRKRIQFMYAGRLMKIQIKYYGGNPEPVLDRLPTAYIVSKETEACVIEAEVYGNGIIMWLLSQGSRIEVLKPQSLKEDMKKILEEMLARYK